MFKGNEILSLTITGGKRAGEVPAVKLVQAGTVKKSGEQVCRAVAGGQDVKMVVTNPVRKDDEAAIVRVSNGEGYYTARVERIVGYHIA